MEPSAAEASAPGPVTTWRLARVRIPEEVVIRGKRPGKPETRSEGELGKGIKEGKGSVQKERERECSLRQVRPM